MSRPKFMTWRRQVRIIPDQLRCVDKRRLAGKMGEVELSLWHPLLLEMPA